MFLIVDVYKWVIRFYVNFIFNSFPVSSYDNLLYIILEIYPINALPCIISLSSNISTALKYLFI